MINKSFPHTRFIMFLENIPLVTFILSFVLLSHENIAHSFNGNLDYISEKRLVLTKR